MIFQQFNKNYCLIFISQQIKMDSYFYAPSQRGRLQRKPFDQGFKTYSPDKPADDSHLSRKPAENSTPVKQQQKGPVPRYGANKRSQNIKNTQAKQQQSLENTASESEIKIQNKNKNSQLNNTVNESTNQSPIQPNISKPRYGANRRVGQLETVANEQTQKEEIKEKNQNKPRLLQRKNQSAKRQKIIQTPKKSVSNIPAAQLKGQKLQEVQSIVRNPLNRRKATPYVNQPKQESKIVELREQKTQEIKTIVRNPLNRRKQAPQIIEKKEEEPKKTVPNTLIQNFIKPVNRQARYGQQVKKNDEQKNQNSTSRVQSERQNQSQQIKVQPMPRTNNRRGVVPVTNKSQENKPQVQKLLNDNMKNKPQPTPPNNRGRPIRAHKAEEQAPNTQKIQQLTPSKTPQSRNVGKKPAVNSAQKKVIDQTPTKTELKRSNTLIYLSSRLYKDKLKQNFEHLYLSTKQEKIKFNAATKLLFTVLNSLYLSRKYQVSIRVLQCIVSQENQLPNGNIIKQIPTKIQQIRKKQQEYAIKFFHSFLLQKYRLYFNHLRVNQNKSLELCNCLQNLVKNKVLNNLNEIKVYAKNKMISSTIKLDAYVSIAKSVHKQNLSKTFHLLKKLSQIKAQNASQEKVGKKSTRITEKKKENQIIKEIQQNKEQDSQILRKKKAQFQQSNNLFKLEKDQWQANIPNFQSQKDLIKGNCLEQQNIIQQKKHILAILKGKVDSIQIPQENYIQQMENIQDTKFAQNFQIYLKILKQENLQKKQYRQEQLDEYFPYLAQDLLDDNQVKKWSILMKNKKIKEQVQAYEGVPKIQRKAAIVLQDEFEMIYGIVRSYIKEKYIWQWIKLTLNKSMSI